MEEKTPGEVEVEAGAEGMSYLCRWKHGLRSRAWWRVKYRGRAGAEGVSYVSTVLLGILVLLHEGSWLIHLPSGQASQ